MLNFIIEEIQQRMKQANVKATHYFREANDVADHLVKLAMNSQKNSSFDSFQHLPARAKGPFYLDKGQMPSIRLKYDETNFFASLI